MSVQLVTVDPRTVEVALDVSIDMPAVAMLGIDDGKIVGTGGLAWGKGRCWIFFTTIDPKPSYGLVALKAFRRLINRARQLGETEIYAVRDPKYATSERLCRLCGFEPFAVEDGQEVLRCKV